MTPHKEPTLNRTYWNRVGRGLKALESTINTHLSATPDDVINAVEVLGRAIRRHLDYWEWAGQEALRQQLGIAEEPWEKLKKKGF